MCFWATLFFTHLIYICSVIFWITSCWSNYTCCDGWVCLLRSWASITKKLKHLRSLIIGFYNFKCIYILIQYISSKLIRWEHMVEFIIRSSLGRWQSLSLKWCKTKILLIRNVLVRTLCTGNGILHTVGVLIETVFR